MPSLVGSEMCIRDSPYATSVRSPCRYATGAPGVAEPRGTRWERVHVQGDPSAPARRSCKRPRASAHSPHHPTSRSLPGLSTTGTALSLSLRASQEGRPPRRIPLRCRKRQSEGIARRDGGAAGGSRPPCPEPASRCRKRLSEVSQARGGERFCVAQGYGTPRDGHEGLRQKNSTPRCGLSRLTSSYLCYSWKRFLPRHPTGQDGVGGTVQTGPLDELTTLPVLVAIAAGPDGLHEHTIWERASRQGERCLLYTSPSPRD